jgi:hypothetical protein
MNRSEEPGLPKHQSKRVVSLPCGHQVYVELDASLLALSGPVLDHQSTCRPERLPTFPAWFPLGPLAKGDSDPLVSHRPTLGGLLL